MALSTRKIINDPVHGFITIDHPLILDLVAHPYFQRLRRIKQMAFAMLVYPGAEHTRLHHALGAYHLMGVALNELKSKGVEITDEECLGAKLAILLHDVGHGPFSHALEHTLIPGVHHETLSLAIMQHLNDSFSNQLDTAIAIFTNQYHKPFLHQLISGQLDVDRMDYLTRDSFFTGVSEGVIGYDRILKMLTVHEGQLMVEEKGIFSIEKFLVARRLMYWQVYLHKTVIAAEMMLVKILERARRLAEQGRAVPSSSKAFHFFLTQEINHENLMQHLDLFCRLDDVDVLATIKGWMEHPDAVLSNLCTRLINRSLLKVKMSTEAPDPAQIRFYRNDVCSRLGISEEEAAYFVFEGEANNTTYNPIDESIQILFKNGVSKDISRVDHALIQHNLSTPVKKYYICYLG
jgi:uncharacterized protein